MKKLVRAAAVAGTILALAACGSGSPSGGSGDAGGSAGGSLTKVTVGVIPIVDTAPIWLGDKEGFFADEGLDLDIQTASGGAAIIPGVQSGSYDFAFSNLVSLMVANDKGLDMKIVANGNSTTGTDHDFSAVVVSKDSKITSPKDLAGKKVSVNNLSNIGDTTIKSIVEKDGGNPKSINFVEVGFPDAPAALDNGVVDAAWILDPFLTQAVDDGARVISNNFTDFDPKLDISAYFTSQAAIDKNPELAAKFKRAMDKSLEFSEQNPDKVRDIVGTYTKIDAETRKKLILPKFQVDMNREAAQKLGAAAVKFGTLSQAPDLDVLLP